MEQQILNYPNHFFSDGILYRGENVKRVIKPDDKGLYKVRYKSEDHFLTIGELLTAPSKKSSSRDDKYYSVTSVCKSHGLSQYRYKQYIAKQGINVDSLTPKEQEPYIIEFRDYLDRRLSKDSVSKQVKVICDSAPVNFLSYKNWLRRRNIRLLNLEIEEHQEKVSEFFDTYKRRK